VRVVRPKKSTRLTTCLSLVAALVVAPILVQLGSVSAASAAAPTGTLQGISCTDALHCWVVGSTAAGTSGSDEIFATADGGVTWSPQVIPSGDTGGLLAISCVPSTEVCLAGGNGGNLLSTSDGGTTWVVSTIATGFGTVEHVSCTSITDCWLTDGLNGVIYTTADGGTTWTAQTSPGKMFAVSCASSMDCWAVGTDAAGTSGGIDATVDGGTTWTAQTPPATVSTQLQGITCESATVCWAFDSASARIDGTTDGGTTWTTEVTASTPSAELTDASCISSTYCVAVGAAAPSASGQSSALVYVSHDMSTWTQLNVPAVASPYQFNRVFCTTSECLATGSNLSGAVLIAIGASVQGSAVAGSDGLTVTGSGGTDGVDATIEAQYVADPLSGTLSDANNFFDVALSAGNTFRSAVVSDCNGVTASTSLAWWNPATNFGSGGWAPVIGDPGPTYVSGSPSCVVATIDASSYPTVSQLNGTEFGVTPTTAQTSPFPPGVGTVTSGGSVVTVSVIPPTHTGGSPITGYTVTCSSSNGGLERSATGPPGFLISVAGLTNGRQYACTVTATNVNGTSPPSAASRSFVPATVPGAPGAIKAATGWASARSGMVSVTYAAPSSDGGAELLGYTVTCTSSDGGAARSGSTGSASTSKIVVKGVTTAKSYHCAASAHNAIGAGASSAPSPTVVVGAPAAPTAIAAQEEQGFIWVTFRLGASNGSQITGERAICTSSNGGRLGTLLHHGRSAAPLKVPGVTPGRRYMCVVTEQNARGASPRSSPIAAATTH
jgi:photosystem II stability/assembly factor-like uncharacterized protein